MTLMNEMDATVEKFFSATAKMMEKYTVSGPDGDFVITGESVRVAYTDAVANGEIYGRKDLTEMPDIIDELNNSGVLMVNGKTDRPLTWMGRT